MTICGYTCFGINDLEMSEVLLGLDIGSSSIKASLVAVDSGQTLASSQSPADEMPMTARQSGWAEQDPEMWWQHTVRATRSAIKSANLSADRVKAIGISYQMHGLVVTDKAGAVLRPSIIWCDSRAVETGEKAMRDLGEQYCLEHLLNSPANFTASKLKWVRDNEPEIFSRVHKLMLPGDYIAMRLTGEITTTDTGLSEGIFWDYQRGGISETILQYYGIDRSMVPDVRPVFSVHGEVRKPAANELGLNPGVKVSYRAGDQPNNAFSLNVLNPGETAATAGTSGVIYSVTGDKAFDPASRVNTFIHVNNSDVKPSNGVLLCINGTGILNSWLRRNTKANGDPFDYATMNQLAASVPIGAGGLSILPFGNGAERILGNRAINASFTGLDFNRHTQAHIFRAAQEGIVFSLKFGIDILQGMGLSTNIIRAGNANMFLSPVFREAFVNTTGARLELFDTHGAKGAALGAGVGAGLYRNFNECFRGLHVIGHDEAANNKAEQYLQAYDNWKSHLNKYI